MSASGGFPHPAYARYVLEPGFHNAQRLLFPYMMAANEAHVLMLTETGILPRAHAAALLAAIQTVSAEGPEAVSYRPEIEDLFFVLEGRLIELAGEEAGGNLQIARSRNDLDATMARLLLRDRLTVIMGTLDRLRAVLLDLAERHIGTIMPGITHTQPAQPTTLAHYLLGVLGPLTRDRERLAQAYVRVNQSPLGAAAFTTTSFPIDRELTARLLGFDGLVENGYDAVGAADHMNEVSHILQTAAGSLARFVHDLLIWARDEVGVLRVGDEFIQISSIMPQKRNPVVLEHIRIRLGYVLGDAVTVATLIHAAAFGDTNDVEDPMYPVLARCFEAAEAAITLLTATLETATIDVEVLARRATEGNMTSTALAEALVQEHRLPFRTAHGIVSRAVRLVTAAGTNLSADDVNAAAASLGRPLAIDDTWLQTVLDPWGFVETHNRPGGPAPTVVARAIADARDQLERDRGWLTAAAARTDAAAEQRRERIDSLISQRP